jgi:hypothetical protein
MGRGDPPIEKRRKENGQDASCPFSFLLFSFFEFLIGVDFALILPSLSIGHYHERF